jgi:hypothetical protein
MLSAKGARPLVKVTGFLEMSPPEAFDTSAERPASELSELSRPPAKSRSSRLARDSESSRNFRLAFVLPIYPYFELEQKLSCQFSKLHRIETALSERTLQSAITLC